jgi:molecular chaperone GrpE
MSEKKSNEKTSETPKTPETPEVPEMTEAPQPSIQEQLDETKDKYLRLMAEFDNFRRRTSKEKLELITTAAEDTVLAFLPVVDDLERAIDALDQNSREGIELIYQKFLKILSSKGVEALDIIDKPFDEETSEAVARVSASGKDKAGVVIEVIQKGYKMYDKIIRYAKVVVGE